VSIFNPTVASSAASTCPNAVRTCASAGTYRNRLFMCGSTAIYSLYVSTQGAAGG
jgi:gluconolactonase